MDMSRLSWEVEEILPEDGDDRENGKGFLSVFSAGCKRMHLRPDCSRQGQMSSALST
jgi:hypothetical protein